MHRDTLSVSILSILLVKPQHLPSTEKNDCLLLTIYAAKPA